MRRTKINMELEPETKVKKIITKYLCPACDTQVDKEGKNFKRVQEVIRPIYYKDDPNKIEVTKKGRLSYSDYFILCNNCNTRFTSFRLEYEEK